VVVDALDRAGLATLEARDGVEALDLYQYHRDAIRLVILDLTMPNLDGEETCREFRRRGSRMPIVLTSGFDEAEVRDRLRGLEVAGFIQKPFGLDALVELVLRLLPAQA
jgi:two-component system cell cycle sensor histidine kinase/response regulator CckA